MRNLLRSGAEWLGRVRTTSMSDPVTYTHAGQSATVPATTGKTTFPAEVEAALVQEWEGRDFLFLAADLTALLADCGGEPQHGDQITDSATGEVFEVSCPAGLQVWCWSGPPGVTMRIHTKKVAS